jgi:hypothetical protein
LFRDNILNKKKLSLFSIIAFVSACIILSSSQGGESIQSVFWGIEVGYHASTSLNLAHIYAKSLIVFGLITLPNRAGRVCHLLLVGEWAASGDSPSFVFLLHKTEHKML